jgi:hypothetical protein
VFAAVKAFKMKLKFFRSQLSKGEMCRFPTFAQRIPQHKHAEIGKEYAKQTGLLICLLPEMRVCVHNVQHINSNPC